VGEGLFQVIQGGRRVREIASAAKLFEAEGCGGDRGGAEIADRSFERVGRAA
jgi:hypothetical protein